MRQPYVPQNPYPSGTIEEECTVLCASCNTTSNTSLRTPFGMLCPGCYKLLHNIPNTKSEPKKQLVLV